MWTWVADNSDVLNVALNALMLIVWGLYFQLLLNGYRRTRRSKILINRTNSHGLATQCVVTNMSAEAIFIEGVIAEIRGEEAQDGITCSLTDYGGRVEPERTTGEDGYQGPLNSGRSVEIGPYSKIIEHVLEATGSSMTPIRELTLTVVATYGPEDRPVAARRHYNIVERAGRRVLLSEAVTTEQIHSRAERRQIELLMREQASERAGDGKEARVRMAAE